MRSLARCRDGRAGELPRAVRGVRAVQRIERINNVDQPRAAQSIETISKTTDPRKGVRYGIGMVHNPSGTDDLYIDELGGNGVSLITDVSRRARRRKGVPIRASSIRP